MNTNKKTSYLKAVILITIVLVIVSSATLSSESKTLWTIAQSGLRIRSGPTLESEKTGLIPFGEKVQVLSEVGPAITIDSRVGQWTEVEYNETTGWVFSGFLISNSDFLEQYEGKKKKFTVSSRDKLLEVIQSNSTVTLKSGNYNISQGDTVNTAHVSWQKSEDNYELILSDLSNCTIQGSGLTEILSDNPFSFVITLRNCRDITIKNLTIRHTLPKGGCLGGVIFIENSEKIYITETILDGSGSIGIWIYGSSSIVFTDNTIRNCSEQIAKIYDSMNITLSDSLFSGSDLVSPVYIGGSDNIIISDCTLEKCRTSLMNCYPEEHQYIFEIHESSRVIIDSMHLRNNEAFDLINTEEGVSISNIIEKDNLFHNQKISEGNMNAYLIESIMKDSSIGVKYALSNGTDINHKTPAGVTPLSLALSTGKFNLAETLIEEGADPSIAGPNNVLPLTFVLKSSYEEKGYLISLILDREVTIPDDKYLFPLLIESVKMNEASVIYHYFDKGYSVNTIDSTGNTLLHYAAVNDSELTYYLIEHGADPAIQNSDGDTPFDIATGRSKARLFNASGSPEYQLFQAVYNGDISATREALANKPDLSGYYPQGWTPLHQAVDYGDLDLIQLLIDEGADTSALTEVKRDPHGTHFSNLSYPPKSTPVDVAILKQDEKLIEYFLEPASPTIYKKGQKVVITSTPLASSEKFSAWILPYGTEGTVVSVTGKDIAIAVEGIAESYILNAEDISPLPLKKSYADELFSRSIVHQLYEPASFAETFLHDIDFLPDYPGPNYEYSMISSLGRYIFWNDNASPRVRLHLISLAMKEMQITLFDEEYEEYIDREYSCIIPYGLLESSPLFIMPPHIYNTYTPEIIEMHFVTDEWSPQYMDGIRNRLTDTKKSFFSTMPERFYIARGSLKGNEIFVSNWIRLYSDEEIAFNLLYILHTYFPKKNSFSIQPNEDRLEFTSPDTINFIIANQDGTNVRTCSGTVAYRNNNQGGWYRRELIIRNSSIDLEENKDYIILFCSKPYIKRLKKIDSFMTGLVALEEITDEESPYRYFDFDSDGVNDIIAAPFFDDVNNLSENEVHFFNVKGEWVPVLRYRTHMVP